MRALCRGLDVVREIRVGVLQVYFCIKHQRLSGFKNIFQSADIFGNFGINVVGLDAYREISREGYFGTACVVRPVVGYFATHPIWDPQTANEVMWAALLSALKPGRH